MARKARMYTGNPPTGPDEDRWSEHPASPFHLEKEGTTWRLYVAGEDTAWPKLKLCADGKAKNKANYWLFWSKRDLRFVRSREAYLLYLGRAKLYAAVESALQAEAVGL